MKFHLEQTLDCQYAAIDAVCSLFQGRFLQLAKPANLF